MNSKILDAKKEILKRKNINPKIAIVLGSGLGEFGNSIEDKCVIPYSEIPHFKKTTVIGHQGSLILGKINGVEIIALQGRFHPYEGYSMDEVVFPIRVVKSLGIKAVILTNAAGGVNLNYKPGDLVIIKDHINFMGKNPLIGPNDETLGKRFPDMTDAYDKSLRKIVSETAKNLGMKLNEGVYFGVLGPTYETPAEINMIRILGGDMVGMSTIPETIAAAHMDLKVCGISCITNMGAGILDEKLDHDHIKDVANKVKDNFTKLISEVIRNFGSTL